MSTPNFKSPVTNPFGLGDVGFNSTPTFADIDGDGDLDAFVGEYNGNTLFYRNRGSASAPDFEAAEANPFGLSDVGYRSSPTFADIDGDGDLDAFVGERDGNTLFYRNKGSASAPDFEAAVTNPFGLSDVRLGSSPTLVDIDKDGDLDAFVGERSGNTRFYRNKGSASAPDFEARVYNPFGLSRVEFGSSPTFADIDKDGDLDAFVGKNLGNTLFFENAPPLNAAPTAVSFSNTTTSLVENADTDTRIKVADIAITDDGQGTNALSLTGDDAASFEIDGNALYLKAGTVLDYETKSSYKVAVNADDTTVGSSPDASQSFSLSVTDVPEAQIINGTDGSDDLRGGSGNDTITGFDSTDSTPGTGEQDTLTGRAGSDKFVVGEAGLITYDDGDSTSTGQFDYVRIADFNRNEDSIQLRGVSTDYRLTEGRFGTAIYIDNVGATADEIVAYVSETRGLSLTDSYFTYVGDPIVERGRIITGTDGNDFLSGGAGDDTITGFDSTDTTPGTGEYDILAGGAGRDLFVVGEAGSIAYDDGISFSKGESDYAEILDFNSSEDTIQLRGVSADYRLVESGDSTLIYIDNVGATADELVAKVLYAKGLSLTDSYFTYVGDPIVDRGPINGTPGSDVLGGSEGDDIINGLASDDRIDAGAGNDRIDGGTGNDSLTGGSGDDTYLVDTLTDVVIEAVNEGTDLVIASRTYTLSANVENLTLTDKAVTGTGNSLNNVIIGNSLNNVLNGGAGIDTMIGGAGNDTYIVDSLTDVVTEAVNEGIDLVKASSTYSLSANVENLTLTGRAVTGTGNTLNNVIIGNSLNNVLNGGAGNDTLDGGAGNDILLGSSGNDILTGGSGSDQFIYRTPAAYASGSVGKDSIVDFSKGTDKIVLSKTTFAALASGVGTGFSAASEFAVVSSDGAAKSSSAAIVYNSTSGSLFYNENGTAAGLGTGTNFAVLTTKPTLSANDFVLQA